MKHLTKMNRELKFRAWDTKRKIFVDEGEICFCFYGDTRIEVHPNSITYIGDEVHNGEPQGSRFIIKQFTGLKDVLGKEIYEGDLFQVAANKIYLVKWCDGGESNFEWYGGAFVLYLDESLFFPFDEYAITHGKIIGNIRENTELWRGGV